MKKLWYWCINNWLFTAVGFLIAFIPLYPKIPIFDIVQTWVYVRLEDLLVGALTGLYLLSILIRKKFPATTLTWPILVYWAAGLISVVAGITIINRGVANFFPHLAILHFLRRIEYMMVFFLAFEAISKSKRRLGTFVGILSITILLIFIYGIGQKFAGWPAFLTMNEEFAKGVPLKLPPTARIAATFGGHYDLAAYLVLVIPILGSLIFAFKKFWQKLALFVLTLCAYVLLLLTASRVSFGVYLAAITVMLIWQKKYLYILPVAIGSFLLLNLVGGAAERFYKTFSFSDVVVDLSTGQPIGTLDKLEGASAVIKRTETPDVETLPRGSSYINVPTQGHGDLTAVKTIELFKSMDLATGSGEVATISGSFLIQKALVYDISITTRFQAQWPKAIAAFKRNIFLGSGFSYLSLAADGDYHRMLGETGVVGTIAFLGIFAYAFRMFFREKDKLEMREKSLVIGIFAGLTGLLFNAFLIDVFEASKVAFSLWLFLGLGVGILGIQIRKNSLGEYGQFIKRILFHPLAGIIYLGVAVFLIYGGSLSHYFIGDDFTWLRWAAETNLSDLGSYFTDARGFFYRPIPKVVYFLLFSVFWLKPLGYHLAMLLLFAGSVILVYLIQRAGKISRFMAWIWSAVYLSLAIHHENVFWISGLSSVLSTFFLLLGIYLWLRETKEDRLIFIFRILGSLAIFLSMLSHDSMWVAPILIVVVYLGKYGKMARENGLVLFLIPIYWWMRMAAGAYLPEGDYAVNIAKLPVNIFANLFGYLAAIPVGPRMIETMQDLRLQLKDHLGQILVMSGPLALILGAVVVKLKADLRRYKRVWVWIFVMIISLTSYLGLGGMAERNAIISSTFWVMAAATLSEMIWAKQNKLQKFLVIVLCGVLIVGNIKEVKRVEWDWKRAGQITQQSLLSIKTAFFPVVSPVTFAIVNTPIRYGSAWVYPTGLADAMWLMFREAPFKVEQYKTVEEAFRATQGIGRDRQVLVFEDFVLKKAMKEEVRVEED